MPSKSTALIKREQERLVILRKIEVANRHADSLASEFRVLSAAYGPMAQAAQVRSRQIADADERVRLLLRELEEFDKNQ